MEEQQEPNLGQANATEQSQEPKSTQGDRKLDEANKRVEAAKALDEADKIAAKTQRRSNTRKALKKLKPIQLGIATAAIVALVLLVSFVVVPSIKNRDNKGTILTETQLQEVVAINKLSTARSVYRGIAIKYNEDGSIAYHVYYKSDVTAGIDMKDITYTIDEANKVVTPILPEPTINSPEVDASSIEFFEQNPSVDMGEALSLCKQDALEKVSQSTEIKSYATANLQKTVEALMNPLLSSKGYSISWDVEAATQDAENDEAATETAEAATTEETQKESNNA